MGLLIVIPKESVYNSTTLNTIRREADDRETTDHVTALPDNKPVAFGSNEQQIRKMQSEDAFTKEPINRPHNVPR